MSVRVEVIPAGQLDPSLVAAWSALRSANPALSSPYFHPAFTEAVGAVRRDAYVAVLLDRGREVAFFPFQRDGLRRGRPIAGPLSDFHGVIAATNEGWDGRFLVQRAGLATWDFDHLIVEQTPFTPYHRGRIGSPVIDLAWHHLHGDAKRHRLRQKLERDLGPIRFEPYVKDKQVLRQVLQWKSLQCTEHGGADVFGPVWTNSLVDRLHDTRTEGFSGMLSGLFAGDILLAGHMGMRSEAVWHYWFPSYNRAYAKYSPGLLLLLEMAHAGPSLSLATIDLGTGDAAYKSRVCSGVRYVAKGSLELVSTVVALRHLRKTVGAWSQWSGTALRSPRMLLQYRKRRRFL